MAAAEARAVREAAEARLREVEKLEAEFNALAAKFAERVGVTEPPPEKGWFGKLFGGGEAKK
jgi:hypothetical protein